MKIVVIGGSGLIGSKLVNKLRQLGHTVNAASPASGVNTITGEGLNEALKGTDVVVDVSNSPSFEDKAVMDFFTKSTRNQGSAEALAGVKHHVAMSIVGTDRLPDSGYLRAKLAMEALIRTSGIPYSILRSTQFFEFAAQIAQAGTTGKEVHISTALFQPIASDEVVAALTNVVVGTPLNAITEVAGPAPMRMCDFIAYYLHATGDPRQVVEDKHARYFGAELSDNSLIPGPNPHPGKIKYEDWLSKQLIHG